MASSKNFTEVLIGGKVFTLSGFESEEYLQKVSTYLNHKIDECSSSEGYRKQSAETRSVLLALNIADDYFNAENRLSEVKEELEEANSLNFKLKHDLAVTTEELDNLKKAHADLEAELKVLKRGTRNR